MVKITINDLSFSYGGEKVLDDLNIIVGNSEIVALVGPNGSGKTTLLKCIDGILRPRGSIFLGEVNALKMSRQDIARYLGYVPQSDTSSHSTTVFDTVLMGRRPRMGWRVSGEDLERVAEVLELLKIGDFAMKDFDELSGGQKQKVLIARALCQEPEVLLLDEPTSNLDLKHQLDVMEMIRDLVRTTEVSVVMAIHDLNLASRYADNLVMLKGGRIYAAGDPATLLTPENIKSVYSIEAAVIDDFERPYIVPIRSLNGGKL